MNIFRFFPFIFEEKAWLVLKVKFCGVADRMMIMAVVVAMKNFEDNANNNFLFLAENILWRFQRRINERKEFAFRFNFNNFLNQQKEKGKSSRTLFFHIRFFFHFRLLLYNSNCSLVSVCLCV